jgi:hypothetical protein
MRALSMPNIFYIPGKNQPSQNSASAKKEMVNVTDAI